MGTNKGSRSLLQALRSSGRRSLGVELRRPRPPRRHRQNASATQTRRLLAVNRVHPSSPASRSCILWGTVQVAVPPAGYAGARPREWIAAGSWGGGRRSRARPGGSQFLSQQPGVRISA
ncbi:hypothetical protein NDU88_006762 [Pleurodeles waltl]|uniref:Uncharacterized protein n=1 Tax=Pleurodeles waltl TaxID=8319 RepID=A0AAV7X202_PLEWA|nr:hypothetical protein NDU88_006762 [Pleurodeles waltl]